MVLYGQVSSKVPSRLQRTSKLRYGPSPRLFDLSGTYPVPSGGIENDVWNNGNGTVGPIEIWINVDNVWTLVGKSS